VDLSRRKSCGGKFGSWRLLEKPVAEGTVLNVRARGAPESIPWAVVEVRTCRPAGGDWELNCGFVETPSWNVLLHFG
jgi:hypothetical protein